MNVGSFEIGARILCSLLLWNVTFKAIKAYWKLVEKLFYLREYRILTVHFMKKDALLLSDDFMVYLENPKVFFCFIFIPVYSNLCWKNNPFPVYL